MISILKKIIYWVFFLVLYAAIVLCVGVLLGALAFMGLGSVFSEHSVLFLLKR